MGEGRMRRGFAAVVVALLWMGGAAAVAQSKGEVAGRVLDAAGQPLQGIEVKLHQIGGEESLKETTGADGTFDFGKLGFGTYSVTTSPEGYAPSACPGFRLLPGTSKRLEIRLAPAGGDQTSSCTEPAEEQPGS